MKLLLDTRLLLWAAGQADRLPAALVYIEDSDSALLFSVGSL